MPYKVKRGVVLVVSRPVERLLEIMEQAIDGTGLTFFHVTSGVEGPHRDGSLHFEARAVDIGDHRPGWSKARRDKVLLALAAQRQVTPALHFLPETDHLHIEWRGSE